VVANRQ